MYRCITELCGIVFDIDGFSDAELAVIKSEFGNYRTLCMTFSDSGVSRLKTYFIDDQIHRVERFQRFFAPNKATHVKTLKKLGVRATELLYVSKRIDFLRNAMGFMGGTAWVTKTVSYENASTAPDLICESLLELSDYIKNNVRGFFGEVVIYPDMKKKRGVLIPVDFSTDNGLIRLYMLGRYFGYTQYMSQLHPYSSAIFLNKRVGGKAYGSFNKIFEKLLIKTVKHIQIEHTIDGICSVPPRPGVADRFSNMLREVADKAHIEDLSTYLVCKYDYPSQKGLTFQERKKNIKGVFAFEDDLTGKSVVIVDDIVTTGATLNECISVLYEAGAAKVVAIAFAINQYGRGYWTSNVIQVSCPTCSSKMRLLINSHNRSFFYSCMECRKSKDFENGRKEIELLVNGEFNEEDVENDPLNWD